MNEIKTVTRSNEAVVVVVFFLTKTYRFLIVRRPFYGTELETFFLSSTVLY